MSEPLDKNANLIVWPVFITENREGETDDGEEPAQPAEVKNVSQFLLLMSESLH